MTSRTTPAHPARGRTRIRRAAAFLAAAGLTTALTSGCSTPDGGGVTLGKNWAGVRSFVVVDIAGTEAVAGVDPVTRTAEPLALVPRHADDDEVLAPQLTRLADGHWVLAVARDGGKPDRLYRLDEKSHRLVEQGDHEALYAILPGRTLIADAKGLDGAGPGAGAGTEVLVKDPKDWRVTRKVQVPGPLAYAASDPASDTVCLLTGSGRNTTVHSLELRTGKLTSRPGAAGTDVQGLACPGGSPVTAGVAATGPGGGKPGAAAVTVAVTAAGTAVTASTGRVDDVQAGGGGTTAVAVAAGERTEIVEVNTRTGEELRRVRLDHPGTLRALRPTDTGWLAYTQDAVSVVDRAGTVRTFALPGSYVAG
ncbi:hypothetical protein NX801_04895 [Streptomyces sp. LP05-1]|uniref:Lipoprotein n=1 Tax=Streptomyces pyxinae TaxID=2970734 RepID=A0ABT2CC63_9ACTN|nr:hypothetical protein [Streptomyces sp. LP05-1]MCS0635005.1 hypothetical protein [Streptomyces sp. LP05-1]